MLIVIKSLGHSATVYQAAKERLEKEYGSKRRQTALCLEELDRFQSRSGHAKDIADLLNIAAINLREAGHFEELSNGILYTKLQKKILEEKLTQYHCWIYEKGEKENIETLRKWVIGEAEIKTVAVETIHGLKDPNNKYQRKEKSFFKNSKPGKKSFRQCVICGAEHVIWTCNKKFKSLSVHERWKAVKQHNLSYRCQGVGHLGQENSRIQTCIIDGCKEMHNRMLRGKQTSIKNSAEVNENIHSKVDEKSCTQPEIRSSSTNMEKEQSGNDKEGSHPGKSKEKEQKEERSHTTKTASAISFFLPLRTVAVVVCNDNIRITVSALLDDASTKTLMMM